MAILSLEDQTGSAEVVLFPDVFNSCSHFLKSEEPLLITGLAELSENSSKIIAKDITTLDSVRSRAIKGIEFLLNHEVVSRDYLEVIREIFLKYQGESSVFFKVDTGNGKPVIISANNYYRISPSEEMLCEIEEKTGRKIDYNYQWI